jgi:hypothetical protein
MMKPSSRDQMDILKVQLGVSMESHGDLKNAQIPQIQFVKQKFLIYQI